MVTLSPEAPPCQVVEVVRVAQGSYGRVPLGRGIPQDDGVVGALSTSWSYQEEDGRKQEMGLTRPILSETPPAPALGHSQ